MEQFVKRNCCTGGYHVYKEVWEVAVEEMFKYVREPENTSDRYAMLLARAMACDGAHYDLHRNVSNICRRYDYESFSTMKIYHFLRYYKYKGTP